MKANDTCPARAAHKHPVTLPHRLLRAISSSRFMRFDKIRLNGALLRWTRFAGIGGRLGASIVCKGCNNPVDGVASGMPGTESPDGSAATRIHCSR